MKKRIIIAIVVLAVLVGGTITAYVFNIGGAKVAIDGKANQVKTAIQNKYNENLTTQVKKENNVLDAKIYTETDMAIGAIVVKREATEQEANALAQKYANQLKAKYKDKRAIVQVVTQDKKNLASIDLP